MKTMDWTNGYDAFAESRAELLELAWCDECQAGSSLKEHQRCVECGRVGPDNDPHPWLRRAV